MRLRKPRSSPAPPPAPPAPPALQRTRFLPHSDLEKVKQILNTNSGKCRKIDYCKHSLLALQENVNGSSFAINKSHIYSWIKVYNELLRRVTYSHDWNQLACLLRAAPVWEHSVLKFEQHNIDNYLRAYLILLMNHPAAKTQELLSDYMHMVLSCRSEQDKRAVAKVFAALPDKLIMRNSHAIGGRAAAFQTE